jgi:hypothetical protein
MPYIGTSTTVFIYITSFFVCSVLFMMYKSKSTFCLVKISVRNHKGGVHLELALLYMLPTDGLLLSNN